MSSGRLVLLVTSPRLPAGLLSADAWDAVRAHPVLAASESAQADALRAAGETVKIVESATVDAALTALREYGTVVWLVGPADEEFARAVGVRLVREPQLGVLEL